LCDGSGNGAFDAGPSSTEIPIIHHHWQIPLIHDESISNTSAKKKKI
jgi:hypothetical protein